MSGRAGRELLARIQIPEPWKGSITASLELIDDIEQARQVGDVWRLGRVLGSPGLGFDEALGHPGSTGKAGGEELEVVSVEQAKSTFLVRARGKAPQPQRGTRVAIRGRVSQVPHGSKPGHVTIYVDRPRLVIGGEES